jgi:hypothetical protein
VGSIKAACLTVFGETFIKEGRFAECQFHINSDLKRHIQRSSLSPIRREQFSSKFSKWLHSKTKEAEGRRREDLKQFELVGEIGLLGFLKYALNKSAFLEDAFRNPIASGNTAVESNFSKYKGNSGGNVYDNVVCFISESAILDAEYELMRKGSFAGRRGPGIMDFRQRVQLRGNGADLG